MNDLPVNETGSESCTGIESCCTPQNQCTENEGDCDSDADCEEGLVCGTDNCPVKSGLQWNETDDCCKKPNAGILMFKDS